MPSAPWTKRAGPSEPWRGTWLASRPGSVEIHPTSEIRTFLDETLMRNRWHIPCSRACMRRLRRQRPGARWFVTVRCARGEFRFRPDAERSALVTFYLAKAARHYPQVALHAVVVMSNHIQMVVTDGAGQLSAFMRHALGPLARSINRMDAVRGPLFERRYCASEIVDDDALLERIEYTATNPVAANLVERVRDWRGLCLWQGGRMQAEGWVAGRNSASSQKAGTRRAHDCASRERARLCISPVEVLGRRTTSWLKQRVALRVRSLRRRRGGNQVLGMRRVLEMDVFRQPDEMSRSPEPLCHATSPRIWAAFREGWRDFCGQYREASAAFRSGYLMCAFPEFAFRPPAPRVA